LEGDRFSAEDGSASRGASKDKFALDSPQLAVAPRLLRVTDARSGAYVPERHWSGSEIISRG
jgi:hypothetical protein